VVVVGGGVEVKRTSCELVNWDGEERSGRVKRRRRRRDGGTGSFIVSRRGGGGRGGRGNAWAAWVLCSIAARLIVQEVTVMGLG